ncbi:MAG: hypothetical protein GWN58_05645, partial [Anaerolineae bacterium]|nr:hypothetical protein [Anaerolineae bacterium]
GLLHKLRVLAGALVHKPFMPKPEKLDPDDEAMTPGRGGSARDTLDSGIQEEELVDGERVADLLSKQQREQGD